MTAAGPGAGPGGPGSGGPDGPDGPSNPSGPSGPGSGGPDGPGSCASSPSSPSSPANPAGALHPRREEDFAQSHSGDTGEILFSASGGSRPGPRPGSDSGAGGPGETGPGDGGRVRPERDRVAEAVAVMARIRRDGRWESAQTHASLLPYLVEESWELVDAVADGDRAELVSELGDLLLQVLFHSAIGAEHPDQPFDIQDVAGALLDKLRRRAPYWFTDDAPDHDADPAPGPADLDAAEQDRLWQEAKAAERAGRPPRGVVEGIAWDMPALALGQKVLERVRSAGIPDDLVPTEMRVIRVEPTGLFRDAGSGTESGASAPTGAEDSGSAEVEYRQVVRRFARTVAEAESRLTIATADASPAEWRAAWPLDPESHLSSTGL